MLKEEQVLRKMINSIFEEEDESTDTEDTGDELDLGAEGGDTDLDTDEGTDEDTGEEGGSEEGGDSGGIKTKEFEDDEEGETDEETETDEEEVDDSSVVDDVSSDVDRVKELFKDTGNPDTDYSLSNPNNKKLAKFKFIFADIDLDSLMTPVDKEVGVSEMELLNRLTPEQRQNYYDKAKELREMFDGVGEREKNIIIWNSNIPLTKNNEEGKEVGLNHNELMSSFKKIDEYLTRRFNGHWQDNPDAIDLLQEIKINFDESGRLDISPRMISQNSFELVEDDNEIGKIAFNKLYVKVPFHVEKFIQKMVQDGNDVVESSIFRTLSAAYTDTEAANNTPFVVIGGIDAGENIESDIIDDTEEGDEDTGEDEDLMDTEEGDEDTEDTGEDEDLMDFEL